MRGPLLPNIAIFAPSRAVAFALVSLSVAIENGCANHNAPFQDRRTLADAIPPGSYASPWTLVGEIWSGTFDEARPALGDEADGWGKFNPQRVWLAIYAHEHRPSDRLTLRILAFESREAAGSAYDHFEPVGPERRAFDAGDRGCWSDDGVMVAWGRLVIDAFGAGSPRGASPEQAAYLAGHLEKRLTSELVESPR